MSKNDDTIRQLIRQTIDLHVHVGPELIPRKYTAASLVDAEKGKLAGAVLKNHYYPTVFATIAVDDPDFVLIPGLVLNNFVGGLNPEAVYATATLVGGPFVVWLPTMHAEQFLSRTEYEVAPEWVRTKGLQARKSATIKPVRVTRNGVLTTRAKVTIDAIASAGAIVATGHISWQETELVADYAVRKGVRAVIVTHPIYQHIKMPLTVQRRLVQNGCYMEQCYSMWRLDGIALDDIAAEIKAVGADGVVLSSDVGQAFSPAPSEALYAFCQELSKRGVNETELRKMLVTNPRTILGIQE